MKWEYLNILITPGRKSVFCKFPILEYYLMECRTVSDLFHDYKSGTMGGFVHAMDELGREGWELVLSHITPDEKQLIMQFKRQLEE